MVRAAAHSHGAQESYSLVSEAAELWGGWLCISKSQKQHVLHTRISYCIISSHPHNNPARLLFAHFTD